LFLFFKGILNKLYCPLVRRTENARIHFMYLFYQKKFCAKATVLSFSSLCGVHCMNISNTRKRVSKIYSHRLLPFKFSVWWKYFTCRILIFEVLLAACIEDVAVAVICQSQLEESFVARSSFVQTSRRIWKERRNSIQTNLRSPALLLFFAKSTALLLFFFLACLDEWSWCSSFCYYTSENQSLITWSDAVCQNQWRAEGGEANGRRHGHPRQGGIQRVKLQKLKCCDQMIFPIVRLLIHAARVGFSWCEALS